MGVLRSSDFGESWTISLAANHDEILALDCHEQTVVALDGNGFIYRTTDDGENWEDWSTGYACSCGPESREADLEISADGGLAMVTGHRIGIFLRAL